MGERPTPRWVMPAGVLGALIAVAAIVLTQGRPRPPSPAPLLPAPRVPVEFRVPTGWVLTTGPVPRHVPSLRREAPGFTTLELPGKPLARLILWASDAPLDHDPVREQEAAARAPGARRLHRRQTSIDGHTAVDLAYLKVMGDGASAVRYLFLRAGDRSYAWLLQVGQVGSRPSEVLRRFRQASADLDRMLATTRLR